MNSSNFIRSFVRAGVAALLMVVSAGASTTGFITNAAGTSFHGSNDNTLSTSGRAGTLVYADNGTGDLSAVDATSGNVGSTIFQIHSLTGIIASITGGTGDAGQASVQGNPVSFKVPEPATFGMIGVGLLGLGLYRSKKSQIKQG